MCAFYSNNFLQCISWFPFYSKSLCVWCGWFSMFQIMNQGWQSILTRLTIGKPFRKENKWPPLSFSMTTNWASPEMHVSFLVGLCKEMEFLQLWGRCLQACLSLCVHLFLTVPDRIHGLSCLWTVMIPRCVQGWSPLTYLKRACCLSEAFVSRLPLGLYVWTFRESWHSSISCSEQLLDHCLLCSLGENQSLRTQCYGFWSVR